MTATRSVSPPGPPKVCFCYVQNDIQWKELISNHIRNSEPGKIPPLLLLDVPKYPLTSNWQRRAEKDLSESVAAILLLSKSMFESRQEGETLRSRVLRFNQQQPPFIIPILLSACPWRSDPRLSHLTVLPANDSPMDTLQGKELDEALDLIADTVRKVVESAPEERPRIIQMASGTLRRIPVSDLRGALWGVPKLPAHYLPRDKIVAVLKKKLFRRDISGIPVSGWHRVLRLSGESGVGKTVVASAFARDPEVSEVFPDGVFWLNMGPGSDINAGQRQLAQTLNYGKDELESGESRSIIRQALQQRRILLILDDVQARDSIDGLVGSEGPGRLLITTPEEDMRFGAVDMLEELKRPQQFEALQILAWHAGVSKSDSLPKNAGDVAKACGNLPLALAVVGAVVRVRAVSGWGHVLEMLKHPRLSEPDPGPEAYKFTARKAIDVGTNLLTESLKLRFTLLSEFAKRNRDIGVQEICGLWKIGESEAASLLTELDDRNLLAFDSETKVVRIHPLVADYLARTGPQGVARPAVITSPAKEVTAPFCSDTAEGEDQLDITRDVNAFAAVLASRQVQPPLCLGIFGDWGAGKTFFMDKLKERIEFLAGETRKAQLLPEPGKSAYCSHVAQINFNAWHYVDANLWASLACRIFEGLDECMTPKKDDAAKSKAALFHELTTAKVQLELADQERKLAAQQLRTAEQDLAEVQNEREKQCINLNSLWEKASAQALKDKPAIKNEFDNAVRQLGLPALSNNFTELERALQQLKTLPGRLETIRLSIFHAPDRAQRIVCLIGLLVLAPLFADAFTWTATWFTKTDSGKALAQLVGQGAAIIGVVTAWINRVFAWGNKTVAQLEDAKEKVDAIIENARKHPTPKEQDLQKALAATREKEAMAKATLKAAEERVTKAEEQYRAIESITDGRRMAEFIRDRVRSRDYRSRLGIIATIRCDFQSLSDLLTEQQKDSGGDPHEADSEKNCRERVPKIDRIVLYIDDLDRCPEHKVVEVLQAVHLLLYFKLFVVVIAVDSRWLVLSLEKQYKALQNAVADTDTSYVDRAALLSTTPQNYLEKIIQIPFNLRPMDSSAFKRLVASLLPRQQISEPEDAEQQQRREVLTADPISPEHDEPSAETSSPRDAEAQKPEQENIDPSVVVEKDVTGETETDLSGVATANGEAAENIEKVQVSKPDNEKPINLSPESLKLTEREEEFIKQLSSLVRTPRSVKRFINIYCVIRASVAEHELPIFLGRTKTPPEYQPILILLAVQIGFPLGARAFFQQILNCDDDQLWDNFIKTQPETKITGPSDNGSAHESERSAAEQAELSRLRERLRNMSGVWDSGFGMVPFKRRVHTAVRFSFRGLKDSGRAEWWPEEEASGDTQGY